LYIIIHQEASLSQYGLNTFHFIWIVAIVFAVLGYIFNVIESLCSREAGYLQSKMESGQGSQYLETLLRTPPIITIHMECYHEETRTRTVSYRDSHGNIKHRTEHYTVEVKTWSGKQRFNYLHWKDTSNRRNLPQVTSTKPKMVNLHSEINFVNETTERAFEHQKQIFIEQNRHRDTSYRTNTTKEIYGFKKHIFLYDIEHGLPSW